MRNQGIGSWTARRARRTPRRTALVHEGRTTGYAALHERSTRLAHALLGQGVGRGDRIAYLGPNHPSFLEALFAAGMLGAVLVPLNTRLTEPELRYQLADSGSTVLVHHCGRAGGRADGPAARLAEAVATAVAVDAGPGLPYEALIGASPDRPIDLDVGPDDLCLIMYTSGTTGRPKGALLTHGNILWNSLNVLVDTDLGSDEVALVAAPLFHTGALNMSCLPTLLKGGTVVLESAFDPERTLELVQRHRVTCMFGVPAMYDAVAAAPGWAGTDLSGLRTLLCGGAPVPARTARAYLDRGLAFVQGYGMTETAPGALVLDRSDAVAHAGTAGVPHFFTDVRVLAPSGEEAAPGERGEVVIAGPNVTPGYWNRPEATAEAFRDGAWFRSGDVAEVDGDGYVRLVDRIKDMIISGGENVYPAEVEDALLDHPAVAECAVFGVPDTRWGEVGRAVVVLRPGARAEPAELLAHLDGRLARYKIPRSVLLVSELPRNATGKLLKGPIRARYGPPAAGSPDSIDSTDSPALPEE
ncbi:long-chain fatty acid--CoA ligase [Streptomyces sp. CB01881]|uniref:acyl-CoA synthetase n=1 Tax=Streptomyces sp. CB01881 TaxID=2078691 RepID=UPI000CDC0EBD|nr:long-chain fatty acid--CoA ligase [Streptomyces sp. CB01881]AUY52972.1 p-hydroxycinnamoyl-CoA synthetase [Streptomyces sp. CB01881]TYC70688.1 long-chain-fatty-acid--CoA ligase [Streptomyces sp. CB01881]